ncbi:hypothetical protein [Streptomyces iconiensis]|uniref:Integral membrane protein n=1 Tax=Streptomyces iconiensis TaxID=1384038 RepID=A0ABT6ZRY0_9ACTN|nr:hypothetical protein [Streptomyces iconiensis]MDJ1131825.1 hypothetical protein [Streptomyces iconiensis]
MAAGSALLLVTVAVLIGSAIEAEHGTLRVGWPPFYARWKPHLGPGTPAALLLAAAVVLHGPALAARLPWRRLVLGCWGAAMAWTWFLALIDGPRRGVAERLTTRYEYLTVIDRFADAGAALRGFTDHILLDAPANWPPHVAGHPPAAVLTFVGLDRVGLGGGAWAAAWCVTVGASAAAALLIAVRVLTDEERARRAAPFLVLAPGAVWMGVSADGYFAGVAAWSLALLALAATGATRVPRAAALCAGLLGGLTCYLSYGLTLCALIAATVLLLARNARPLPYALGGVAAVALAFSLAGFNWWEGFNLLHERYYQGAAAIRPYGYWVWANPACTVAVVGLASAAGLRRALSGGPHALVRLRRGHDTARDRLVLLALAALVTVAVADLSGMSKAETERIWLPFALWLLPCAALLPVRGIRWWLAAQATVALLVNHLLLTGW